MDLAFILLEYRKMNAALWIFKEAKAMH